MHWSQLEVLAQRVADHAHPDDVPDVALNIVRDVVGLRKKSFSFFSRSTQDTKDEKVKQSNANHAHIISVLERVLAKLETLAKARPAKDHGSGPRDSLQVATSDLTNMFAYLELQTSSDAVADAPAEGSEEEPAPSQAGQQSQKGGKKKGSKKTQKLKKPEKQVAKAKRGANWVDNFRFGLPGEDEDDEEEDEFDLYMMVYCFFEDFNTIRNYVAERWCDYWYDRSVPLDTLAVITSAAFDLFHQLEYDLINELRPLSPKLARYDFMMEMLFYHFGIDHVDYDSYDDLDKESTNERIWREESDWLGLNSCFVLKRTLSMIPPGKVPMLTPSQRTPTTYGAKNLAEWKAFEDSVTGQLIMEAAHLKALKKNGQEQPILPSESQLLLDLQTSLMLRDYTSSLIFSLHLWVDIRNIVETDCDKPFELLQPTAARLKEALEAHNPTKYCRDHDFKRRWLARTWETKHYMVEDFMFDDKKARFRQVGYEEDPDPFFLLQHEPVWAGLLDFRARLVQSQLGHEFVMLSSIVDAAAYLYHAALAADRAVPRWAEMETYAATYVEESRFRRGLREEQGAAIIRNFADLDPGQRGKARTVPDLEADERFVPDVAVRWKLHQRYCHDDTGLAFVDYVDELSAQRQQIEGSKRAETQITGALTAPDGEEARQEDGASRALVKHANGAATKEFGKGLLHGRDFSQLSPIDMLRLLDTTVTSQLEGLLTLDYFRLFDDSVALLEAVVEAFGPEMQERLGPRDADTPTYLERLPVVLGQDLEGQSDPADILDKVIQRCRTFLQTKQVPVP